ncbi:histidine triad nucleotide-binding protein [Candidatus Uhrbacteria bacterium]|nr:histidine triad nucleotide-binding protein [Candidatus Uhrbacteria bacterium]
MVDCVFCNIAAGELPARMHETDDAEVVAFDDLQPQAPVHVIVIPRQHIPSFASLVLDDAELVSRMVRSIRVIAERLGIQETGYRVVTNSGPNAGQAVPHLHFHLLGGAELGRIA